MARSLNKVLIIGNLTRDPELRYTPSGTAVCTFSIATNRQWKTEAGDQKDEAEFHRIVAWDKLAEICSKMLKKGSRTYVEGRLQTRNWQGQDGAQRTTTEIVISDMLVLDGRRSDDLNVPEDLGAASNVGEESQVPQPNKSKAQKPAKSQESKKETVDDVSDEDIPF